jgi:hypothetical protein
LVILLEIVHEERVQKRILMKNNYKDYKAHVKRNVTDKLYFNMISLLLSENKEKRLTSRDVLNLLFNKVPDFWIAPKINKYDGHVSKHEAEHIRDIIKVVGHQNKINRCNQGYISVLNFLNKHNIHSDLYSTYSMITLMILSSIFGKSGFNEEKCLDLCLTHKKMSVDIFYDIIKELLSDMEYISILYYKI